MTEQEKNKLIERTCKFDAYQAVWLWAKGGAVDFNPEYGDAAWYAKEKMNGHLQFLKEHKFRYSYVDGLILNDGHYSGIITNDSFYDNEAPAEKENK